MFKHFERARRARRIVQEYPQLAPILNEQRRNRRLKYIYFTLMSPVFAFGVVAVAVSAPFAFMADVIFAVVKRPLDALNAENRNLTRKACHMVPRHKIVAAGDGELK